MITGIVENKDTLLKWSEQVIDFYRRNGRAYVAASDKNEFNKYTKKQRGALHVWCDMCAEVLNQNNIEREVKHPFRDETYSMKWTGAAFKEDIYKFVLEAMTGKTSTEDQSTVEPSDVAMVISKRYAENGLICPPWPSLR